MAAIAFISTNLDDMLLLILFFSNREFRPSHVVIGQFLGIAAIILVSLVFSLIAQTISPSYVRLLGLLPIYFGLRQLLKRNEETAIVQKFGKSGILTVAAATLGSGGDNISLYGPLFSTHSQRDVSILVMVFFGMTGLWCLVSYHLVNRSSLKEPIQRYGSIIFPWVLLMLGIYILVKP